MSEPAATTSESDPVSGRAPEPCRCDAPSSGSPDRRTLLKGLAVAGVAVPFLAACGSGGGSRADAGTPTSGTRGARSSAPTTSTSTGGGGGSAADVLTPVSAVALGGGVILASKETVVTQPEKGTFEGFSAICTHMGCTVGTIAQGAIICPCHGSMYSIKDGSVLSGPAPAPLPKKPVKLVGTNIVSG